jgi:hypothetical protein
MASYLRRWSGQITHINNTAKNESRIPNTRFGDGPITFDHSKPDSKESQIAKSFVSALWMM